jgi:hypothetical protein
MGVVGLVFGIICIVIMCVALIPCLGAINWFNIPLSIIGLIISIIATVKETNKTKGIIGITLCSIAIVIGFVRLVIGLGVF